MYIYQGKYKRKKLESSNPKLKFGDKIVTYSGLFGKILSIDENKVIIEIEPDKIKLTIDKWSIAGIEE